MSFGKFFAVFFAILVFGAAVFAAVGDLDTTFNPVLTSAIPPEVTHIAVQPDGKIIIAGYFSTVGGVSRNGIARLNADGSLDTSFDPGTGFGFVQGVPQADSLAVAPDGKIIVGGNFPTYNGTARKNLARLNTDGTLDTSFVFDPTIIINRINAVAVQADGKVLIGVALSTIKRLNADGTTDTAFATTMVPQVGVIEIKLQQDGKILIGGGWDFLNGAEYRFGLARLNPADGSTDNSFVPHQNDFDLYRASVAEILPQKDGKIVAVGNLKINSSDTASNKHIVRFNADGTIDGTFNSGADANNTIWSVHRQANGKYVIGGPFASYNGVSHVGLARINADGSLDDGFNANVNPSARVEEIVPDANGRLLIGGNFSQVNSTARTGFARIKMNSVNKAAICDYDGDGKTDFALRRIASGQFWWYIGYSGGGDSATAWGKSGDQVVCGDYDGDGKTDLAVFRATGASPTGFFYIFNSADNTIRIEQFGQNQDNATIAGDYDGDGKTDLAVYRNGAAAGEQSYFFYRGSNNNPDGNVTYIPWGTQFDRPYTGDFDGDGKADFAVQRTIGGLSTHFILQSATNSYRIAYMGAGTDSVIPGDFNGDGITDIALLRNENSARTWYVTTDFGATYSRTVWGINNALGFVGDYDGDGKSDISVYQNDTNGGGFNFFVLKSTDNSMQTYRFGQNLDFPIATFNTH